MWKENQKHTSWLTKGPPLVNLSFEMAQNVSRGLHIVHLMVLKSFSQSVQDKHLET